MEANYPDELKNGYRITVIMGIAMIASVFVYAVVIEILKREYEPFEGFAPFPEVEILRAALLAIAIVEFFLIRFIKKLILSIKLLSSSYRKNSLSPEIQKLSTAAIITYALCDSVAIYGLVLFLIGGSSTDFYIFMGLSLIYFSIYFPRYSEWEDWMKGGSYVTHQY